MSNRNSIPTPSAMSSSGVLDKKKLLINYLEQQKRNPTKYSITNKGTATVAVAASSTSTTPSTVSITSAGTPSSSTSNWKSKRYEEAKSRSRQSLKAKKQNTSVSTTKNKDAINANTANKESLLGSKEVKKKVSQQSRTPIPKPAPLKRNSSIENGLNINSQENQSVIKLSQQTNNTKENNGTILADVKSFSSRDGKSQLRNNNNSSRDSDAQTQTSSTEISTKIVHKKSNSKRHENNRNNETADGLNGFKKKEREDEEVPLKENSENGAKKDPDFEDFMDELKREMKSEHTEVSRYIHHLSFYHLSQFISQTNHFHLSFWCSYSIAFNLFCTVIIRRAQQHQALMKRKGKRDVCNYLLEMQLVLDLSMIFCLEMYENLTALLNLK